MWTQRLWSVKHRCEKRIVLGAGKKRKKRKREKQGLQCVCVNVFFVRWRLKRICFINLKLTITSARIWSQTIYKHASPRKLYDENLLQWGRAPPLPSGLQPEKGKWAFSAVPCLFALSCTYTFQWENHQVNEGTHWLTCISYRDGWVCSKKYIVFFHQQYIKRAKSIIVVCLKFVFYFFSFLLFCSVRLSFRLLYASIVGKVWQSSSVTSEGSADRYQAELPSESIHSKANEWQSLQQGIFYQFEQAMCIRI